MTILKSAAPAFFLLLASMSPGAEPASADPAKSSSNLGIGFLWTTQSRQMAGKTGTGKDFVDVILGPGKMEVFREIKPPMRVACIARSLVRNDARPFPGIQESIELLKRAQVSPERVLIAYNPEGQPGTPAQELDELVESVRKAKAMAAAYGAPLVVGPGLRYMQPREHLYPELARSCDIWMIQSQRLQLDEAEHKPVPVSLYREKVRHIVDRLRSGNPNIRIFVQLVTTAERGRVTLGAAQIAAYARSIEGLVDAVRIYGAPAGLLAQIIDELRPAGTLATPSNDIQR